MLPITGNVYVCLTLNIPANNSPLAGAEAICSNNELITNYSTQWELNLLEAYTIRTHTVLML